jgi:hypothetical protein
LSEDWFIKLVGFSLAKKNQKTCVFYSLPKKEKTFMFYFCQKNRKLVGFTLPKKNRKLVGFTLPKKTQKTFGFYSRQRLTLVLPASFLCIPHQGVKD